MFDKQEKEGVDVARRRKVSRRYYKKIMPTIYTDFFVLIGVYKKILSFFVGLFRPMYREVMFSDLRVITHKSVALAAENFMLSMAEEGYDISTQYPKLVTDFIEEPFDYVLTVCDSANELCPVFPNGQNRVHNAFVDPSRFSYDSEDHALEIYRDTVKQIFKGIDSLDLI